MVKEVVVPEKDALLDAMKVSEASIEAAGYLVDRFTQVLKKAKMLDTSQDILKLVKEFADFVRLKLASTGQPWAGIPGEAPGNKTVHENLAKEAAARLAKVAKDGLKLDIAIGDQSQLLRGYTEGGKSPDAGIVTEIDALFNSWLAKNNIASRDSTLFETNASGEIKTDVHGNPIRIDVDVVKKLISDSNKGFEQFMADKGFKIEIQQHEYPREKMGEEKRHAVKQAIEEIRVEKTAVDTRETDKPEPDKSHSMPGGAAT